MITAPNMPPMERGAQASIRCHHDLAITRKHTIEKAVEISAEVHQVTLRRRRNSPPTSLAAASGSIN